MISIGFFSEMKISMHNSGSIKQHIIPSVKYDKNRVAAYLDSFGRQAVCPREAIDCVTGKVISSSFAVNDDGEYCWPDFLSYHVRKYNIDLPKSFVDKIYSKTAE
ncbi:MAG: hypothetical protein IJ071_05135 [Ruminococcus sp.]|nr:hypothetical protein [Ruminococcus sp.]